MTFLLNSAVISLLLLSDHESVLYAPKKKAKDNGCVTEENHARMLLALVLFSNSNLGDTELFNWGLLCLQVQR